MGWFTPSTSSTYSSSSRHHHHHHQPHRVHHTSASSRRRPRDGYINRIVYQLRRLIRQLVAYARRHPVKLFMMVVMPLITGGALGKVLRQLGIRLPAGLAQGSGSMFLDHFNLFPVDDHCCPCFRFLGLLVCFGWEMIGLVGSGHCRCWEHGVVHDKDDGD